MTEIRYFHRQTHTINGITLRKFVTDAIDTDFATELTLKTGGTDATDYLVVRVWKRDSVGTETLLKTWAPSATSLTKDGFIHSVNLNTAVASFALVATDAIIIDVSSWSAADGYGVIVRFITEQLPACTRPTQTWHFVLYYTAAFYGGLDHVYFEIDYTGQDSRCNDFPTCAAPVVASSSGQVIPSFLLQCGGEVIRRIDKKLKKKKVVCLKR